MFTDRNLIYSLIFSTLIIIMWKYTRIIQTFALGTVLGIHHPIKYKAK